MNKELYLDKKKNATATMVCNVAVAIAFFVFNLWKTELYTDFWNYKNEAFLPYLVTGAFILCVLSFILHFVLNEEAWRYGVLLTQAVAFVLLLISFLILNAPDAHESEFEVFLKRSVMAMGICQIIFFSRFFIDAKDASMFFSEKEQ